MNELKTEISFITPVYNGEKHIAFAIESFIAQNNPYLELIIVDDGSKDNTSKICKAFCAKNKNIHYIYVENGGAGRARNIGISYAKGNIIGFLDSDDLLIKGSLSVEKTKILKEEFQNGLEIIYTSRLKATFDLESFISLDMPEEFQNIKHHMPKLEFVTALYNKQFIEKNHINFYEYKQQDIESAFRYQCCAKAKYVKTKTDMIFYLQRDNLTSNTHTWNKYNLYRIKALVYLDLLEKSEHKGDSSFLYETSLKCVFRYYQCCFLYGYQSKEEINDVHQVYRNLRKNKTKMRITHTDNRYIILECVICFLDFFRNVSKLHKAKQGTVGLKNIQNIDEKRMLEHWSEFSKKYI